MELQNLNCECLTAGLIPWLTKILIQFFTLIMCTGFYYKILYCVKYVCKLAVFLCMCILWSPIVHLPWAGDLQWLPDLIPVKMKIPEATRIVL